MKVKNLLDDNENKPSEPQRRLPIEVLAINIIIRFKIPDNIFANLLELYYEINSSKWKSFGNQLVGQIDNEPEVTAELREKYPLWTNFCNEAQEICNDTNTDSYGCEPEKWSKFLSDELLTNKHNVVCETKLSDYNQFLFTQTVNIINCVCKSTQTTSERRKEHYESDGRVTFMNNSGTDLNFSASQCMN